MKVLQVLEGKHSSDVTWCDFSPLSLCLATASNDKTVRVWSLSSSGKFEEQPFSPLCGHSYGVNCVHFSPHADTALASCSTDGSIIIWNTQTGEEIAKLEQPNSSALRTLAFSPTATLLAAGGDDEKIVIWELFTQNIVRVLSDHEAMVTTVTFSPDGLLLVSGSSAGDLKLWDGQWPGHGRSLATRAEAHDLGVTCCEFRSLETSVIAHQREYLLASCGNDDLVRLWQVVSNNSLRLYPLAVLSGHTANVMCARFAPGPAALLASVAGDKRVIIWDTESGQKLQDLEKHCRYVTCCAWSADSTLLATGSNDRTVIIWTLNEGQGNNISSSIEEGEPQRKTFLPTQEERKLTPDNILGASGMSGLVKWSVSNVARWLSDTIHLPQFVEVFVQNDIDGKELLHLTHDSLQNMLKIESLGHRNQILRGIQTLKNPLWALTSGSTIDSESLPEEFICPITHEVMIDPVVAADGYSYERIAMHSWLEAGNKSSPMTNQPLAHSLLTPNHALRLLIKRYKV